MPDLIRRMFARLCLEVTVSPNSYRKNLYTDNNNPKPFKASENAPFFTSNEKPAVARELSKTTNGEIKKNGSNSLNVSCNAYLKNSVVFCRQSLSEIVLLFMW